MFPHMTSMIKLDQDGRIYWGTKSMGAGIQNILWADPRTVADVEQCVNAMRSEGPQAKYPGLQGVGMRRDVGFVLEGGSEAVIEANDEAVCAIMIEKKQAVDNLEALLGVPGVDMVQFGPSDYSMSIGVSGQAKHEKVPRGHRRRTNLVPPPLLPFYVVGGKMLPPTTIYCPRIVAAAASLLLLTASDTTLYAVLSPSTTRRY